MVMQTNRGVRISPAAMKAVDPVVKSGQLRESKDWWKGKDSVT